MGLNIYVVPLHQSYFSVPPSSLLFPEHYKYGLQSIFLPLDYDSPPASEMGKNGGNGSQSQSNGGGGGGNKDDRPMVTAVLKLDLHCEGCAVRIKKSVACFEGVEVVKGGYGDLNKLTVIGNVDPTKLREMVEKKFRKKVELISPAPERDKDNDNNGKENNKKDQNRGEEGRGGGGEEKKNAGDNNREKKQDDKKTKELPVTTAVMKLDLHCQGCIQKIRKIVSKTKGYHEMSIDEVKNLVTVKGSMDMKAVAESLREKLKKPVEIVPAKKETEKKEKSAEGGKGKGGDGGNNGNTVSNRKVEEGIRYQVQYGYPHPAVWGYGWGYPYPIEQHHAPQLFSDENPNACSIM